MNVCSGWEVVCPDGLVRHYPYHNKGDADGDAAAYARKGCRVFAGPSPLELRHPPCPEGKHTTRPIVMAHASAERGEG